MKLAKTEDNLTWTRHAKEKMRFYRLSEARVKRVLRNPGRVEEGIAPGTIALMQRTGSKRRPTEIWLMYQPLRKKSAKRIVTAWRYPGISPIRGEIPIPDDIREALSMASTNNVR